MQTEMHDLKSVREALTGDLEHRHGQARALESEMERSSHRTRGEVPAQVYNELREQMATRLNGIADDRDRQSAELRGAAADHC